MKYLILNTRNQVLECNILFKSGTLTVAKREMQEVKSEE